MTEAVSITKQVVDRAHTIRAWAESPPGKNLQKWISIGLSVLILGILVRAIADIGWRQVIGALPRAPGFWLLFAGFYFLQPVVTWIIYSPWWPMTWRGIHVFLKARVMNEAVFSYSGDTYLLVWAAAMLGIEYDPKAPPKRLLGRGDGPGVDPATSPFAAVKDVAITSGLAGNLMTLLMLILAFAMDRDNVIGDEVDPSTVHTIVGAFAALIVLNLMIVAGRNRVMSLSVRNNMRAFWWHLFRVILGQVLITATWIVALPIIGVTTWILLGALRMVISRLPLPNKELLFAAVAISLTGEASIAVAALMAAQGALHLVFHGISWVAASAIEASGPSMRPGPHLAVAD